MMTVEYSETLAYSAAAVFAALADLDLRQNWQTSLIGLRAEPAGPLALGSKIFETRKYMGYKTENVLVVSAYEPGRQLTLETEAGASSEQRETYLIEKLSEQSCRLVYRTESSGIPKMFEGLARKSQEKELPQNVGRLKSILASKV